MKVWFLKKYAVLGAFPGMLMLPATLPRPAIMAKADAKHYNVLFFSIDDLRPELNAYGATHIKSPNIDLIAKQGLLMQRAYCQQPLCGPTRASLLTGLRPDSTKVYDLITSFRKHVPNAVTLPEYFKQQGYFTASFNKIFHVKDERSWSVKSWESKKFSVRGYALKENMEIYNRNKTYGPPAESADVPDNAYVDGEAADEAIRVLNEVKGKPFFLAVGFYRPHLPFSAPKKYWDMYDPFKIKVPNEGLPLNMPVVHNPGAGTGELRTYYGVPKQGAIPHDMAVNLTHGYYACVSYIDAQVGRLLRELKRLDLETNTIVVLWGDHGWKLGDHGEWGKRSNLEEDLRVPLIISTPEMRAKGKQSTSLVEFIDLYPTLCEAAHLPVPAGLQGQSFYRLLNKPDQPFKDAAFSQNIRPNGVIGYTMRTNRYRYTEWYQKGVLINDAAELYDHQKDPRELVNVCPDPQYQQELAQVRKQFMLYGKNGFNLKSPNL